jgi:hypothetical protein
MLGAAWAAPLELDGPDQVAVGERFDVSVEGLSIPLSAFATKGAPPQIEWRALCGDVAIRPRLEMRTEVIAGKVAWVGSPYATVTAQSPGKIAIVLMCVDAGGVGQLAALEVAVGPFPEPDPQPDPDPAPQPHPEPGKRWLLLIEESSQRHLHPGLADLITSPTLRAYAREQGHQVRFWDKDLARAANAPPDALPWFSRAGADLPRVFVLTEQGNILYEGPPPAAADAVPFLKKYGG